MAKNKNRKQNTINNTKSNNVENGLGSALDLPSGNHYIDNPLTSPQSFELQVFWTCEFKSPQP